MYTLGRKLPRGTIVVSEGDRLRLDLESVRSDLSEFHHHLREGHLDGARALLASGFLGELDHIPTESLRDWIDSKRLRLRSQLRDQAAARWTELQDTGRWAEAASAASVLLFLDPTDERALRRLILAKGMGGRIQEAEASYRSFAERNQAALAGNAWKPSDETCGLIERIRSLRASRIAERGPSPGELDSEPQLVGREGELALLTRRLVTPRAGELRITLVSGEAGIGKSRLIREAILASALGGSVTLSGGSAEFERDIPLNPILEALGDSRVGDAVNRLGDPWQSVLLALMPRFHRGSGPLPEVPYVRPGSVPRRLYEAIHLLLRELVSEGPVVLFLDDFHWADETSISVLEFLRRRWKDGPFSVVLAVRPETTAVSPAVARFLEGLKGFAGAEILDLDELSDEAAHELIQQAARGPVPRQTREEILSLGGRIPFYLIELTVEYLAGRLVKPPDLGDLRPIPLNIRQVLDQRLVDLSHAADSVLAALSVYSHPAYPREIARLSELEEHEAVDGLDELQTLHLVRWTEQGAALRHALIRQTVYHRLSDPRRAWLHGRAARHLATRPAPQPVNELSLHFHRAGEKQEALRFSLAAAEKAEASGAVPEALRFLSIARKNTQDPAQVTEIIGKLAHLNYLHRNLQEAAPLLELASSRFTTLGRIADALMAQIRRIDALSHCEALPLEDVLSDLDRIKETARQQQYWEAMAEALNVEAQLLHRDCKVDKIKKLLAEVEGYIGLGSEKADCVLHSILVHHLFYGESSKALDNLSCAARAALQHGYEAEALLTLNRLLVVLSLRGLLDSKEWMWVRQETARHASRSGDLSMRFNAKANLGVWYLDVGDLDRAQLVFQEAHEVIKGTADQRSQATSHYNRGELCLVQRRVDEARHHYQELRQLIGPATPRYQELATLAGLGLCELLQGDLRAARFWEDRLSGQIAGFPVWTHDPWVILSFLAEVARRRGGWSASRAVLLEGAALVKDRLPVSWIKLVLDAARLAFKHRHPVPELEEALELAASLGLSTRVRQLSALREPRHPSQTNVHHERN
jgi:tetratricopeptide (TPR) repeat protein